MANAVAQLVAHHVRVGAHLLGLTFAYAQVVDQFVATDGIALIEDVFVDRSWRADTAFLSHFFQHLAEFELLFRRRLGA